MVHVRLAFAPPLSLTLEAAQDRPCDWSSSIRPGTVSLVPEYHGLHGLQVRANRRGIATIATPS